MGKKGSRVDRHSGDMVKSEIHVEEKRYKEALEYKITAFIAIKALSLRKLPTNLLKKSKFMALVVQFLFIQGYIKNYKKLKKYKQTGETHNKS